MRFVYLDPKGVSVVDTTFNFKGMSNKFKYSLGVGFVDSLFLYTDGFVS